MTHYYSNRPDFEKGDNTGWGYSNIDCVRNLLTDISEVAAKVKSEGLSDLYVQTGDASLGKDMPESTFVNAEHRALDMLESSKKVHAQVMQNIDGKFVQGIDDSLDSLNQVNEGDNAYTTDHLTYTVTKTQSTYISTGYGTPTYKVKKHYTISEIINHADSPIPAAQALYQGRLALAQEHLAALEAKDKETYERLSGLSDDALVENFFPTQLGKYERLRSTWKEDNKDWLQWVEIGGQVLAAAAIITGSLVSGGVLAPVLIGVGTTALAGNGFYQATSGESLSGRVLSTEERIWSGVEGVTTLATGGFATYAGVLARTGRTASTTVQAMTRATNLVDDVVDVTETLYMMKEDPLLALGGFALGRGVNAATNHIVSKRMAKAAAGGVSGIDLPSRSTRPDVELSSSLSSGKLAIDKSALPDVEVRSSDVPKVTTEIGRVGKENPREVIKYYRVQGGTDSNQVSRERIMIKSDGSVIIPDKSSMLYVSAYDIEHAIYYRDVARKGGTIVEFKVPKELDELIQENAIPQFHASQNPRNQGGMAPQIVDPMTPGTSYGLPEPFIEWLEEYASSAKILH